MALILNPTFGVASGKIGGLVAMDTPFGQVLRSNSIPSNPNTLSQQSSQVIFSNVIKKWGSLSLPQKSAWKTFSSTLYSPLVKSKSGKYSDYNSFVGIVKNKYVGNAHLYPWSYKTVTMSDYEDVTNTIYTYDLNAPSTSGDNQIKYDSSTSLIISLLSCTINNSFQFHMQIHFDSCPPGGLVQGQLINSLGNQFGFNVYTSKSGLHNNFSEKNYFNTLLFSSGLVTFTDHTLSGTTYFDVKFTINDPSLRCKYGLNPGRWYWITLVAIDILGNLCIIGRLCVQFPEL